MYSNIKDSITTLSLLVTHIQIETQHVHCKFSNHSRHKAIIRFDIMFDFWQLQKKTEGQNNGKSGGFLQHLIFYWLVLNSQTSLLCEFLFLKAQPFTVLQHRHWELNREFSSRTILSHYWVLMWITFHQFESKAIVNYNDLNLYP